jgi:serine/threonine protein kinase
MALRVLGPIIRCCVLGVSLMSAQSTLDLPARPLASGTKVKGRYLIEGELGRGARGIVYRARDEALVSRPVVVKVLLDAPANNAWSAQAFVHEIEALSRMDHPGIVGLLDKGELPEGHPFLVMQFVNGVTLRSIVTESTLSLNRAANIIQQLGRALTAVHQHGICHRDLKPENIMLQDERNGEELIKIVDFGLAKVQNPVTCLVTLADRLVGTPYYMSPEQIRFETATALSDIYALGLIAYELLTGCHPFADLNNNEQITLEELQNRQQAGPRKWARQMRPELRRDVDNIIKKALAFRPGSRYERASDLGDELALSLRGQPSSSARPADRLAGSRKTQAVALLYKRHEEFDEYVVRILEEHLKSVYEVFIDRSASIGIEWAREIETKICGADTVVVLLSAASVGSEMLAHQMEIAYEASRGGNKPRFLPIRVQFDGTLAEPFHRILNSVPLLHWTGPQDDQRLQNEVARALTNARSFAPQKLKAEPDDGFVSFQSKFYIDRSTDRKFLEAVERRDSIVLIKGARQMGKTWLLARSLQLARNLNFHVVITDMQSLGQEALVSTDALFRTFSRMIVRRLRLPVDPAEMWDSNHPNQSFEDLLRDEVLERINAPLVWALDEVDLLFTLPFSSDVFGLFRSWHNARALDPEAPWPRLTLAIAYATESNLFIKNPHQSPFNVGTRLTLADLTTDQVAELNGRYNSPLHKEADLRTFYRLLGGQPYLVQSGLRMISLGMRLTTLEQQAALDDGPFCDHLNRFLFVLAQNDRLREALRQFLIGLARLSDEDFYRLRSAGILSGDSAQEARPRCQVYADYLKRHL